MKLMKRFLEGLGERLGVAHTTETVFGEPMEYSSITIIPVARLTYHGEKPEDGEETGKKPFKKSPIGYLEMREDSVRFISLYDYTEFFALGALTGAGACFLLSLLSGRPPRQKTQEEKPPSHPGRKILRGLGIALGIGVLGYYLSRFIPTLSSQCDAMVDIERELLSFGDDERRPRIGLNPLDDAEAEWNSTEVVTMNESIDSRGRKDKP
jgi:hypothetical protein